MLYIIAFYVRTMKKREERDSVGINYVRSISVAGGGVLDQKRF